MQNSAAVAAAISIGNNNTSTTYTGIISGSGSLIKVGTGTLTLGGANTFTGLTTVSKGVLSLQTATSLGTVAAGTIVNANATLQIQNGLSIGQEALTLNGAGFNSGGALRSASGNNTYAGLVSLGSDSRINTDAGTLLISNTGAITGSGFGLSVGGAGNTTFSGPLGFGAGSFTKDGTGTVLLSAANTYSGVTTINAGRLNLAASNQTSIVVNSGGSLGGVGSTSGGLTLNAGSTFVVDGSNQNIAFTANAVNVTGPVTIAFDATPAPGTNVYTILYYGSLTPASPISPRPASAAQSAMTLPTSALSSQ